jgi:phosphoribosylformimino-5-aminoimidazole carboxamide ribotide isomerase
MPAMNSLQLIPVMDLMDGQVVHAREGRRAQYAPIRSKLCTGSSPEAVMEALLTLHPFDTVYFADIDAIQRVASNTAALERLRSRHPDLEFWVDAGIADEASLQDWVARGLGRPVIGSESLQDAEFMLVARDICSDVTPILSLDYGGEDFRGPKRLLQEPGRYWPQNVLAMNLQRVGSDKGPDFALIVELARRVPGCRVHAAGGVRSVEDLARVASDGAAGALIASALHDGRLDSAALRRSSTTGGPTK